jgi:hypothetical protein
MDGRPFDLIQSDRFVVPKQLSELTNGKGHSRASAAIPSRRVEIWSSGMVTVINTNGVVLPPGLMFK